MKTLRNKIYNALAIIGFTMFIASIGFLIIGASLRIWEETYIVPIIILLASFPLMFATKTE